MPENWEIHWEDYYEILQIHHSAEPEIIKAAYGKLAQKYHPDINKDPAAGERMKKINLAYEVLSNPEKRKQYDAEWFQKSSVAGQSALPKPKPVVDTEYISFKDVEPGETQTASFVIRNVGGPYTKIRVSNPDSWVKVVRGFPLTDSDELPVQVEIEAEGDDWDKIYSETIRVRLDEEETQVRVELQTKPAPVREKATVGARPTSYTYTPPSPASHKQGIPAWGKWLIGLTIFGLILGIGELFSRSDTTTKNTSPPNSVQISSTPDPAQTALEIRKQQIEKSLEKYCQESMPPPPIDKYSYDKGPAFTYDYNYVFQGEHIWARVGRFWMYGSGRIIYSTDNGNSWEVQWERERTSLNSMIFLNEYEGIVGIDRDTLIKTSDGGKTWNKFLTLHNMPGVSIWWIDSVDIKSNTHIIVWTTASRGPLYKDGGDRFETQDRGKTWEYITGRTVKFQTNNSGDTWDTINR